MEIQQLLSEKNIVYMNEVRYSQRRRFLEIGLLNNRIIQRISYVLVFESVIELSNKIAEIDPGCIDSIREVEEKAQKVYFQYSIQTEHPYDEAGSNSYSRLAECYFLHN